MKKVIVFLIYTFSLTALISCDNKQDCSWYAKIDRENECLIIVDKLPNGPYFKAKGKHLKTNKESECFDGSRWWTQYAKYIEIGDTIIKKKGELIFSIHKKDTILSFPWECEGKVYK